MISLYHDTENCYSLYGINHFIQKFGLPIQVNSFEKSLICINYGVEKRGEFVIDIKENEVEDRITGRIKAYGEESPIFEVPIDTGAKNQVIAYYNDKERSYPCLTFSDKDIKIGFDVFKETGYLLSGHLDKIWSGIDEASRWEIAKIPVVDFYEELLFKSLLYACEKLNIPLVQKAFWPDGKRFAVCLTHDVDEIKKTYQWITRPLMLLKRGEIKGIKNQFLSLIQKIKGNEPYWTFENIIEIENELGVKSTYFFLNESGKVNFFKPETWKLLGRKYKLQDMRVKRIFEELIKNGHEIGVHGSFYSYRDTEMLREEKKELEEVLGSKVVGIRQHHLNLEIPRTWQYQEQVGFEYDTSLGFKGGKNIGFRCGTCFPFHPYNNNGEIMSILEIPLIIMDISLISLMNSSKNIWVDCMNVINEVAKYGGVLTVLWHHSVFNELEYPGWAETYERIIRVCKEKNAWIATAGEIARWWNKREEMVS